MPLIQTYLPEDYNSDSQNTSIVQDSTGLIYAANMSGVLEFDGVRWQLYRHPDNLQPLSLTVDPSNRVYVGFDHDIGLLKKHPDGTAELVSLAHLLPDSIDPSNVWTTRATPEGIIFEDWNHLLRFVPSNSNGDEGVFTVYSFDEYSPYSAYCYGNDQHVIAQYGVGLLTLDGDSLRLLPGGEFFKDIFIFEMSSFGPGRFLLAALDDDDKEIWYTFENGKARRFEAPVIRYSIDYHGMELMPLRDNLFGLATESGGLALFDSEGNILSVHNRETGLPDNVVHTGTLDREGGLWFPLDFGIARLQINSPMTRFGLDEGLSGTVFSITRFRDTLVVGGDQGVARLQPAHNSLGHAKLVPLEGIHDWTWQVLSAKDRLLVATFDAIYEFSSLHSSESPRKVVNYGSEAMLLVRDSSRVLYGDWFGGLGYLEWDGRHWVDKKNIEETEGVIRNIVQDGRHHFWLTVDDLYLERVTLSQNAEGKLVFKDRTHFEEGHGLPGPDYYYPFRLHGRLYVGSYQGLFRFNRETETFERDSVLFDTDFRTLQAIVGPTVDYQGRVWFDSEPWSGLVATPQPYGKYLISAPLNQGLNRSYYSVYPEPDGIVWGGGPGGTLLRYDETAKVKRDLEFSAVLRRMVTRTHDNEMTFSTLSSSSITLPWDQNSIRFEYSIPRYVRSEQNEFQYRLVGLNNSWSDWSRETYHDFENLREGIYQFEVRGRDTEGRVSKVASQSVRIRPPLHRTTAAYIVYVLFLLAAVVLYQRVRNARFRRINRQLEALVEDRTRSLEESLKKLQYEIAERERAEKERAEAQEQFQQAQRMETVGRLASGLAHDFNNLLSVIHGHASVTLADKSLTGHLRTELTLIMGTAERAAQLIRDLLAYSRRPPVESVPVHIGKLMDELAPMMDRLLAPRVDLDVEVTPNLWKAKVDARQLEQAILNLAVNARDAMPLGGYFKVTVGNFTCDEHFCRLHPTAQAGDYVSVIAADNGTGIPKELQAKVFEPFFTTKGDGQGTGLGLASVYAAVEQVNGVVWIESEEGRGSAFHLLFPRVKD
ncbi:hypothetical protein KQI63_04125 [bacterium]|nr:hypothetical protein [bacterium]